MNARGRSPAVGLVAASVLWATAENARAQQVGDVQQGLKLAQQICSECHLVDRVAGRSTNPDAPTFEAIAQTRGLTSAALRAMLRTPHPTMPNIVIKGQDISDIVAYLLGLKQTD